MNKLQEEIEKYKKEYEVLRKRGANPERQAEFSGIVYGMEKCIEIFKEIIDKFDFAERFCLDNKIRDKCETTKQMDKRLKKELKSQLEEVKE